MSAAEAQDRFPPGTVLAGRFRVERMLGRGGMGAVYGALHLQLGQYFAIKILQGEAARDPDSIARFKQEAQIASRLPGPNVVRVHDLGQTEVGENAFIGSNTVLVAPLTVGPGAYTAAGSAISEDVPAGDLGVARGRQHNSDGWVLRNREGTRSAEAATRNRAGRS